MSDCLVPLGCHRKGHAGCADQKSPKDCSSQITSYHWAVIAKAMQAVLIINRQ
jgi:hypothetical protein